VIEKDGWGHRDPPLCAWSSTAANNPSIDEVLVHKRAKGRDAPLLDDDLLVETHNDGFVSLTSIPQIKPDVVLGGIRTDLSKLSGCFKNNMAALFHR
jgi:hypothetical protein